MPPFSFSPLCAQWLDGHAVPDGLTADAYERLGGEGRAVLKLCIARLHRLWGEQPLDECTEKRLAPDFSVISQVAPSPYALLVCEASYAHPAALLAAVMPAILAGVEEILPCFVHCGDGAAMPPAAPLLAALELAGVERAFHTSATECEEFLRLLLNENPSGSMVYMGGGSLGGAFAPIAYTGGVRCCFLTSPPRYLPVDSDNAVEQRFGPALPANVSVSVEEGSPADRERLFLRLDPAHAHVWVWPDLSPSWFRTRHMTLKS